MFRWIAARMEQVRQSSLRDDLLGGLVSVSLAIPLAMGYGMFAFTALGDSYFAHGALAGLYAAITAGVVCVVLGDRTTTVYAPRVTTTFLLGALLYHLVHSDTEVLRGGNVHLIVLAFFSIIFLGGVIQALFGLIRLGSLIRFTPHPVMAGLQNAAAALLFLVQLGDVCGFDHNIPFKEVFGHLAEVKPLSFAVAVITFIVMWKARVITTKIPPLLVGLGIGTALYFVLVLAGFGAQLGPVIGLPVAVESPTPYRAIGDLTHLGDFAELLPFIVSGAFALALVAAIDALLCAKLVMPAGAKKVDGDRLLMRLGVGNVLSACFGGITSGINIGPSLANRAFGAKTSLSVLINAATLLLMSSVLFPVVSYIPRVCAFSHHHGHRSSARRPLVDRPRSPHTHERIAPAWVDAARSVGGSGRSRTLRNHQYCARSLPWDHHRDSAVRRADEPFEYSPTVQLRQDPFAQGADTGRDGIT